MFKLVFIGCTLALCLSGCVTTGEDNQPLQLESEIHAANAQDARCGQRGETGNCRAYFLKYHFNATTKQCQQFVWGGCGGKVPFHTFEECQKACH